MKQMIRLSLLLLIAILFACGDSGSSNKQSTDSVEMQSEIDIQTGLKDTTAILAQAISESMGISSDAVKRVGNEFIVENDGIVTFEDAVLRYGSLLKGDKPGAATGTSQMITAYVIKTNPKYVKLFANSTVPADWIKALDSAIANRNRVNHAVRYSRQTTSTGATTTVTTNSVASSTIATAAYPDYYGKPGNKITINTYHNGLSMSKKIQALTHELGHTIGFSHTNGTYGYLVSGTPTTDPNSVMNSVVTEWKGFSIYDDTAHKIVYPPVK